MLLQHPLFITKIKAILKAFYHNKLLEKNKDHLRWNLVFMFCYTTCLSVCGLCWKRNTFNSCEKKVIRAQQTIIIQQYHLDGGKDTTEISKTPTWENHKISCMQFLYSVPILEEGCTYSKRCWKIIVHLILYEIKIMKIIIFSNLNLGT